MCFSSKKDLWLGIVLWVSVLIPLIICIWKPIKFVLFIAVLFIIFVAWICFKTGYTINDKELIAQSGPIRYKIELEKISKVRRSRNFLSSPALSLDRLEIEYSNGNFILISPADTEAFLNILRERCPSADIK